MQFLLNSLTEKSRLVVLSLFEILVSFHYLFSKKILTRRNQMSQGKDLVNVIMYNELTFIFDECYLLSIFIN